MSQGKVKPKANETTIKFVSTGFDAYSEEIPVPLNSIIILLPSGDQHQIYEPKTICHEGEWLLNGALQPPPELVEAEEGTKVEPGGSSIVQRLGGGHTIESHVHRWYLAAQGPAGAPAVINCEYVYSDQAVCDVQITAFGAAETWGARYYYKETKQGTKGKQK